jgi:hypothetical protein
VVEPRRTGRRRVAMPKRPRVAAAPPAPGGAPGAGSRHPTPGPDESARCGDPEVAWRPPAGEPMGSARALAVRLTRAGVDPKVAPPVRSRRSPRDRASSARPEGPFGRGIRSAVAPRATRRRLGGADGPPRHGVAIERGSGCPARRAPPRGGWRPSLGRGPPTRPPDVPRGGGPARAPSGGVGTRRRPFRPPRTSAVHPTRGGGRSRERSYASSRGAAEAGHRGAPFHRDGLSATRTVTGRVVSDPSEPSPSPGPGSALTFEALLRRRVRICTAMSPSPWTLSFHGLCAPSWSGIPNRYAGPGGAACGRQDRVRELPREARGAVHERSTRKEARRQRARDGRWARPEGQRFRRAPVGRAPARPAASIPCAGPVPTPGPRANAVVSSTRRAVDCSSEAPRLGRRERRRAGSAP